jgi:hypothetical protein
MSEEKTEIKFLQFCWKNKVIYNRLQDLSPDFKRDTIKLGQNILQSQVKQIESKLIQFMQEYIKYPDSINKLIEKYYPQQNIGIYFYEA